MTRRSIIRSVLILVLGCNRAIAQHNSFEEKARFPGSSLKWIHIAEKEFKKRQLDVDKYTVIIVEEDSSVTVILEPPETDGIRGPVGYEVEICKKDSRVIGSYYSR